MIVVSPRAAGLADRPAVASAFPLDLYMVTSSTLTGSCSSGEGGERERKTQVRPLKHTYTHACALSLTQPRLSSSGKHGSGSSSEQCVVKPSVSLA